MQRKCVLVRLLLLGMAILPLGANAEIYKWRGADGVMRYSDVPPPSNVKQETIRGKKVPKPTGQAPLAPVDGDINSSLGKNKTPEKSKDAAPSADDAAKKRAQEAEAQKNTGEQKQAELKVKQENCAAAKRNLATFKAGGRISRMNEQGEREYLGDDDLAKGRADSERDVEAYCN